MGSTPNMVRSLVVIGALMAVIWFMTPRVNTLGGPVVDVHGVALGVVEQSGWPISEAVDLPQDWKTTSARYVKGTDGLMTWHAGYQAPSGNYVGVEQTRDATQGWVEAQTNRARRIGELQGGVLPEDAHARPQGDDREGQERRDRGEDRGQEVHRLVGQRGDDLFLEREFDAVRE